jgi:hypothetical protein
MFSFSTIIFCGFIGITNAYSQSSKPGHQVYSIYEATTPCNDAIKKMLHISPETKCEMMRWRLSVYEDIKSVPSGFDLIYTYGIGKQGTKGFTESATTVELKGRLTIDQKAKSIIYNLYDDSSKISLSFLQPDQNLLHLLNENKQLMIGTAAWSYTLSRISPLAYINKFSLQPVSKNYIESDSASFGVFVGRVPCNNELRELHGIPARGCDIIKCRLVLYIDTKTHQPTTFLLQTIYVGNGDDNKYNTTGKWKLLQDIKYDPSTVFFKLEPDSSKSQTSFTLLKADDNILFFLDKDNNLMVGSTYCSYTLNRH